MNYRPERSTPLRLEEQCVNFWPNWRRGHFCRHLKLVTGMARTTRGTCINQLSAIYNATGISGALPEL
jgi:hypothetical protein